MYTLYTCTMSFLGSVDVVHIRADQETLKKVKNIRRVDKE